MYFVICGIDLAGSEHRPTGVCILNDVIAFHTVYTDAHILSLVNHSSPSVVAIDAPLSFHGEHFRDGDVELRKEVPILPLTFKGMQLLTQRGIKLKSLIPFQVIEVYPHASKKVLTIATPEDLGSYGFSHFPSNIHQLDAAVAALTGKYYLQGKCKAYGEKDKIIVPALTK
ncbi:MAG: hypothetical protein AYK19_02470 [Theionarchaea archaeon DG-70-1]|nr:MAG: hypothetical protein AYK19_02470 [Theionarchaea archaeon DG-70-1]